MIILTYHRSTNNYKANYFHNANHRTDLGDGRFLYTFLHLYDDKGNDFTGVWFVGVSNPLTQLKNNRIEVRRGAYGSPVNGLHD